MLPGSELPSLQDLPTGTAACFLIHRPLYLPIYSSIYLAIFMQVFILNGFKWGIFVSAHFARVGLSPLRVPIIPDVTDRHWLTLRRRGGDVCRDWMGACVIGFPRRAGVRSSAIRRMAVCRVIGDIAARGGFGAGGGNRSQQELGEMAEGGSFLAGDAALREQTKNLGKRAVHAGGSGKVPAGGMEFGKIIGGADDVASGYRTAEQLFFSFGVVGAQGRMNVGAGHGALAAVGKHELAAIGEWLGFRREVKRVVATVGVRLRSEARGRNVVDICGETGCDIGRWQI